MIEDPLFQAVVSGSFFALGVAFQKLRQGKKKRPMPPNGSALQQQPEPVWAQWNQEIGRAIAGRKEL